MRVFRNRPPESLFDARKVDVVALDPGGGAVELVIVADSPWTGSDEQLRSLQAKVQTYVGFALDGPMTDQYPETVGLPWHIVIDAKTGAPDARTATVLQALAERLRGHGGGLQVRV